MMSDAAFAEQLVAARPVIRACARMWLRDSEMAEDVLQDTLLTAWARRAIYRPQPGKPLSKWLTVICFRKVCDARRRGKRHAWMPLEEDFAPGLDGEQEAAVLAREIRALADRKPGGAALLDRMAAGDDYEAIAARDGIGFGTVKSRISRVRAALQQEMA